MVIQFLLVTYPEQRAVLVDGSAVGFTNHTLMLPADEYTVTLDGGGYQPASLQVVLGGTSIVRPKVIAFQPAARATAAPAATRKKSPRAASRRRTRNA